MQSTVGSPAATGTVKRGTKRQGRQPGEVVVMGKRARAAVFVQRIYKGFLVRRNLRVMSTATRVVQRWWRQMRGRWQLRRDVAELQAVVRGARQRKVLADTKVAAELTQDSHALSLAVFSLVLHR